MLVAIAYQIVIGKQQKHALIFAYIFIFSIPLTGKFPFKAHQLLSKGCILDSEMQVVYESR
jgi:hypothetical protein